MDNLQDKNKYNIHACSKHVAKLIVWQIQQYKWMLVMQTQWN